MDGELIIFPRAGLLTFEINLRSKGAAETNGNDATARNRRPIAGLTALDRSHLVRSQLLP